MWRNTRRCFGWEQSDQGARWGWIFFGSAALAFQQSDGEQRGRRNENGAASALGQARGGFKALLRRQDVHDAWPTRQKAGDGWRTRGVKLLRRSAMTVTESFFRNAIQSPIAPTDRACLTTINSKPVTI